MQISGRAAGSAGKRVAAVFATGAVYGRSMAAEFARAFTALEGQVAVEHVVAEGDRDFGVPMANLPTEVDVVFYGGSLEGAGLVRALREAGGDLLARRPGLPVRGGSRLQPSRAAIPLTEDAEFGRSEQP
ncbi:MAG: hypothetical protein HOV76_20190 [Hamadaea sp.]|nr:hypothetical protein [Hamadaea sp.]